MSNAISITESIAPECNREEKRGGREGKEKKWLCVLKMSSQKQNVVQLETASFWIQQNMLYAEYKCHCANEREQRKGNTKFMHTPASIWKKMRGGKKIKFVGNFRTENVKI
jgi:hypothetical protein